MPERSALDDERHNAILNAARELFNEQGIEAPMSAIARRAGIGMSGLYRRFATKRILIETLAAGQLEWFSSVWQTALDAEEPWVGFRDAIVTFAQAQETSPALAAAVLSNAHTFPELSAAVDARDRVFSQAMNRAKQARVLRPDIDIDDIRRIMEAVRILQMHPMKVFSEHWRRVLFILIDGMRYRPDADYGR